VVSDRTGRGQLSLSDFGGSAFLAGAFFAAFCADDFLAGAFFVGVAVFFDVDLAVVLAGAFLAGAAGAAFFAAALPADAVPAGASAPAGPDASSATTLSGLAGAGGGADRAGGAARTAGPSPPRVADVGALSLGADERRARSTTCAAAASSTSSPSRRKSRRLTATRLIPERTPGRDHARNRVKRSGPAAAALAQVEPSGSVLTAAVVFRQHCGMRLHTAGLLLT